MYFCGPLQMDEQTYKQQLWADTGCSPEDLPCGWRDMMMMSRISGGLPSRCLKFNFQYWNISSWLAAFNFLSRYSSFTSHGVTMSIDSWQSIHRVTFFLSIFPWMYSNYSFNFFKFFFVLVSSLWTFVCFSTLAFVRFCLLRKDIFKLPNFFLTTGE